MENKKIRFGCNCKSSPKTYYTSYYHTGLYCQECIKRMAQEEDELLKKDEELRVSHEIDALFG